MNSFKRDLPRLNYELIQDPPYTDMRLFADYPLEEKLIFDINACAASDDSLPTWNDFTRTNICVQIVDVNGWKLA